MTDEDSNEQMENVDVDELIGNGSSDEEITVR